MIQVLIVDDSKTCRGRLRELFAEAPEFVVIGEAKDGREAVSLTEQLRPDVIVMDLIMPDMDGLEATKEIMASTPTPIVIVSASKSIHETSTAMKALAAGALTLAAKPAISKLDPGTTDEQAEFIRTIRLMSSIKVVRFNHRSRASAPTETNRIVQPTAASTSQSTASIGSLVPASPAVTSRNLTNDVTDTFRLVTGNKYGRRVPPRVIAIAASTGGPPALNTIFQALPRDFPIPIMLVQHIGQGFSQGFADWLNRHGNFNIKLASANDCLVPGAIFVAPDGVHMGVKSDGTIFLSPAPPVGGLRPSATFLFESVAAAFGEDCVAVILTGMGEDGVKGLAHVKRAGGFVIAQDQATCTVFGMPAAAILAGYSDLVLPIGSISACLQDLARS